MHAVDLPAWAVLRGALTNNIARLAPARTALIVIDMQSAFLAPGEVFANPHAMDIIEPVNRLASAFRAAGSVVAWTRQTVDDTLGRADPHWQAMANDPFVSMAKAALTSGSASHALHPAMGPGPDDLLIDKYRYSAFLPQSSDLGPQLKARDIDTLVIVGTLTNCCCESSARDAFMSGFKVLVVSDAMAAMTDAEHNASLLNLRLMFADVADTATVLNMIGAETRDKNSDA
ncbi:isochorismatase family protein [Brevundimonas sp. SORGH_AS_0993]|uniref:isochorismatase family protein n=1 Tax=Brevundimonas sp. SORGH_AS_0993 TaxID=3041794 RepID=UPI002783F2B9|nr:isochorismatase family cysteine hydrolase [Brevundimonas sp. SORGH_AS_0993]MDQ1153646.1 nicotinamidase-related amidase [Brevundimonas sp. SORGH_AS_0993]